MTQAEDITSFAKKNCGWCYGRGHITQLLGPERRVVLCGCALNRYAKTQKLSVPALLAKLAEERTPKEEVPA